MTSEQRCATEAMLARRRKYVEDLNEHARELNVAYVRLSGNMTTNEQEYAMVVTARAHYEREIRRLELTLDGR